MCESLMQNNCKFIFTDTERNFSPSVKITFNQAFRSTSVIYSYYLLSDPRSTLIVARFTLIYLWAMYYEVWYTIKKQESYRSLRVLAGFTVWLTKDNGPVPLALSSECRAARSLRLTELTLTQVSPPLFLYPTAPNLLVHIRPQPRSFARKTFRYILNAGRS